MIADLEFKKELIQRITQRMNFVPDGTVNTLLQKPLADLEEMLQKLVQDDANETVQAHQEEARRQSALEGAYVQALRNVTLNGKRLVDCDSNRVMLENSLQPHEEPSASLYSTIVLSYPTQYSWEQPRPVKTDADRQAEFARICRENNLSECAANQQLHREGAALENWAGASGLERAAFQAEAAQARQTFLIKNASPQQLKEEARFQSATEREIALKVESDRQHAFVSQAQAGLYSPLPSHNQAGEAMDAKYFRRLSTLDYPLFRQLVKKFGTSQITERLRQPAAPTV